MPEVRQQLLDGIKGRVGHLALEFNIFHGTAAVSDVGVDTSEGQPFAGYDRVAATRTRAENGLERWHIGAKINCRVSDENLPFDSATVTQTLMLEERDDGIFASEYGVIAYDGGYNEDEEDARGFTPEQLQVLLAAL